MLPSPTSWISLKETMPPEDVWLLMWINRTDEDREIQVIPIVEGFLSSRTGNLLDKDLRAVEELFEITAYHIITDAEGSALPVER